jgi:predicted metal-dependent phosphoesterase TrpH
MNLETKKPGLGVDFHMHTLASDGLWTPETLVETAAAQGLRLLTVTDHDTIKGVAPVGAVAEKRGLHFISGVEVTVGWKGLTHHLLMYNFDPAHPAINTLLADTEKRMWAKKEGIIEKLKKLGYKLDALDHFRRPDGDFLTIDIVRALVKGDEISTFDRAFNLCLGLGLDEVINQPADKAFAVGRQIGAVMVLAHPGRSDPGISYVPDSALLEFKEMGLDGLEAYHYSHSQHEIERLTQFAKTQGLAVSCGSDSHNESRKPMPWNPELCRSLLERLDLALSMAA